MEQQKTNFKQKTLDFTKLLFLFCNPNTVPFTPPVNGVFSFHKWGVKAHLCDCLCVKNPGN